MRHKNGELFSCMASTIYFGCMLFVFSWSPQEKAWRYPWGVRLGTPLHAMLQNSIFPYRTKTYKNCFFHIHQGRARMSLFSEMKLWRWNVSPESCRHFWLVVWNILYFSIQLRISSSHLTFIFFRGVGIPPTRYNIYIYIRIVESAKMYGVFTHIYHPKTA